MAEPSAKRVFPEGKAYTVSQITGYIREMFDFDALLNGLFVEGEVSNFKAHESGHLYFTLKDGRCVLRAVMFREAAEGLDFTPTDGGAVVAYGYIGVYEKTGQYQFYAEMMKPVGQGALNRAYERLKQTLAAEGLFDAGRKRPIPAAPRCIALVTSAGGAALRDMINVIRRRDMTARIVVAPCAVQGDGAAAKIAEAIALVNEWGGADTLIIGRGGGAVEDLWAFNEEICVRAVAGSRIPTISAVGHETDVTLSDFAADLRAPTPSAAAELAAADGRQTARALAALVCRLNRAIDEKTADARARLRVSIDDTGGAMDERLYEAKARLTRGLDGLEKVSPIGVLRRGYGVVTKNGRRVSSARQLDAGDTVAVSFEDGRITAEVRERVLYGAESGEGAADV